MSVDSLLISKELPYLQHKAQDAQDRVETSIVFVLGLPLNACHHLSQNDKVDNERRGKERVLTDIEDANRLMATEEDLAIILVECTLVVANSRHILDDDAMIGMLTRLIQHGVSSDHIINNIALGDLLGAELLLRRQVLAVIVAEMVVARDGRELDASIDEEIDQGRFHLCLARFEVVTSDEGAMLLGKFDGTGNKGVLRRAINERNLVKNASDGKHGGRSDLLMTILDGIKEIVGGIIEAIDDISVTLGVGSPEDNDLIKVVGSLELAVNSLAFC